MSTSSLRIHHLGAAILFLSLLLVAASNGLCAPPNEEKPSNPTQSDSVEKVSIAGRLLDHLQCSLLIETGATYHSVNDTGESESDIALSTVEMAIEATINHWVTAELTFLFEDPIFDDEEADVTLDTGTLTLGGSEHFPPYATIGKFYVPYGATLTHFPDSPLVDQPVTLTFGEISERALLVGTALGSWQLAGYAFNGSVEKTGGDENAVDTFGADLNYTYENTPDKPSVMVGASYISNLADSDGISEIVPDPIEDRIPGWAAYASGRWGQFFLEAEYMAALRRFNTSELPHNNSEGAKPAVWNIEAGFNYNGRRDIEMVLKYSGSDEAQGLRIPENRYGVTFNINLFEHTVVSLGGLHDQFAMNAFDNGSKNRRDTLFLQLAIEL